MVCPSESGDANELLLAHCAGTLEAAKAVEFERHLMTCEQCRALAEAQREVWALLDAWPSTTPSADFDERLFQRIAIERQRSWWQRSLPAWSSGMPAVLVACCALIAAFMIKTPALNPQPQSQTDTLVKIEQVEHQLDDIELLNQLGLESPTSDRGSEKI